MSISPVNITRISQGLQTGMLLQSLQRNQRDVFNTQSRIAAGRSFLVGSENPVAAARVLNLNHAFARQQQFAANALHADNFLAAADGSLSEISSLLIDASTIASQTVSNLTSEAERESQAEVVAAIRRQLEIVGNRQFNGRFLFGGRETTDTPFVTALGGVAYVGDTGNLITRLNETLFGAMNVPGSDLFKALSDPIATNVNLTPALDSAVRIEDIISADGGSVVPGVLLVNEGNGTRIFNVDLRTADTLGDVVAAINAAAGAAGSSLTASIGSTGLVISGGSAVTITDSGTGETAADLGIYSPVASSGTINGQTLTARLTRLTPVTSLAGGAGIDLQGGLIITNGQSTATVDLSSAATVQDVINLINNAGVYVLARINDAGTGIDVFNRVSGTSLSIGENGGTTASDLGIRTFDTATPLSALNFGDGVGNVEGATDFRITARNGTSFEVNLDGAVTVGDAIDRINQAAQGVGVAVSASFAAMGNGIRLQDGTSGSGNLQVDLANLSTAAIDLGIRQVTPGGATELIGTDVNPTRTDGIIGALIDLEQALRLDDTQAISAAGNRLDEMRSEVIRIHGMIGARSQAMSSQRQQLEDAASATQVFLSEVQDLDYAEAVTLMQQAMVRLQANLQTGPMVMDLSLLEFLR